MEDGKIQVIEVNEQNIDEHGIYCVKNKKSPGYLAKVKWFKEQFTFGLKIKIAVDKNNKNLGFIEYIPSEYAWRPIKAENSYFIQCLAVFGKDSRENGIGSMLIKSCEKDAIAFGKSGICTMTSDGVWMANKLIFFKNDFIEVGKLDRFELLHKSLKLIENKPSFINWNLEKQNYKGWNLIYSDQCPWHEKSANDLTQSAKKNGIILKLIKIKTAEEAQKAPSGFGTFSLVKDGQILGDHYLSKTRFENILKQVSQDKK